jgi:DNA-binding MarR family transcriptional regulator
MTTAVPLLGQVIGVAARASHGVLVAVLNDHAVTFAEWVALKTLAEEGPAASRLALVTNLASRLDTDETAAEDLADGFTSSGIAAEDGQIELTPDGRALFDRIFGQVRNASIHLYSGLDPDDLATTRRILMEVSERAARTVT